MLNHVRTYGFCETSVIVCGDMLYGTAPVKQTIAITFKELGGDDLSSMTKPVSKELIWPPHKINVGLREGLAP